MAIKVLVDKETLVKQAELAELIAASLGAKMDGDIVKAVDELPDTIETKGYRMVKTADGIEYTVKDVAIDKTVAAYKADIPAIIGLLKSLSHLLSSFTFKLRALQKEMLDGMKINGLKVEEYIESKVKSVKADDDDDDDDDEE